MIYGLLLFKMLNTLMLLMLSLIDVTHLHHKEETMETIREHIFCSIITTKRKLLENLILVQLKRVEIFRNLIGKLLVS